MSHNWIDVSTPISAEIVVWPGDDPVSISKRSQIGINGAEANVSSIRMSAHTGTHVDAPLHFIAGGADVTALDLDSLVGPVQVISIADQRQITGAELAGHSIEPGSRVLFRTVNSDKDWLRSPFDPDYVYLSSEAAQYLVSLGIRTIGVDYLSVAGEENGAAVHRLLLGAGITILEGLMMKDIAPGTYEMVALPLKLEGSDGAPARVILRRI